MKGPLLIKPKVFTDERGFFFESWNENSFRQILDQDGQVIPSFVQDNHSRSNQGVLRGLRYQLSPHPQGKLVRCVVGEIFDVAVDLRRQSPTFSQWVGVRLNALNQDQLWVPAGFAHGFLTLSDHAEVLYKTTDYWSRDCERSIRWDDPQISIQWPSFVQNASEMKPLLSQKDAQAPFLIDQPCVF